ncbi:ABC transporter permease [Arvimicrobium flavum]|uniref:ABC transporter permease n=1 Tax=Arvimicrobium flavum TaxID=3393320 RepID=UPI00237B4C55|nr:ABC transporter permease [Mesorhizobium shangrilense]
MSVGSQPSRRAARRNVLGFLARRSPFALALVSLFVVAALVGPLVAPHSMTDTNLAMALQGPSSAHWLGTDPLGRDVLSRLLGASRVAAQAFLIVVLIGGVIGTALGLIAGGRGGLVDLVVSRVTEILQGFPTILVAIVIVALLNPSLTNAMVAVGLAAIPDFARVSRSVAIQLRDREFIEAARGLGASEWRILWSEVLPNMVGPLIVIASFDGAQAILWEASLSFLGLGVQPPAPSFGSMLREAHSYLAIQPFLAVIVGLAVSGFILGLNLLGDALGDYFDQSRR